MITYDFLRANKIRLYQKQAIFTLNMDDLLIFSLSKSVPLSAEELKHFSNILNSFQTWS